MFGSVPKRWPVARGQPGVSAWYAPGRMNRITKAGHLKVDFGWIYWNNPWFIYIKGVATAWGNLHNKCHWVKSSLVSGLCFMQVIRQNWANLSSNNPMWAIWKTLIIRWHVIHQTLAFTYHKTSNISRTIVGNNIVNHSDVVGASPVGAAPTTSSFST